MAGTPSNTVPLGAELLEAMGDIKGAAKAMADEAKSAKADAREAQRELKQVEREAKKARDAIARAERTGTATKEQKDTLRKLEDDIERKQKKEFQLTKASAEKAAKAQAAKDKIAAEREMVKNLNKYEKRINSKLLGVRDSLAGVSNKLQSSNIPALQRLGRSIGATSGAITTGGFESVIQAGGFALRGAAIATAGVAGGLALTGGAQRFIRRNIEEREIEGRISDNLTAALKSLSGQSNTGATANFIQSGFKTEADRARKQIQKENLLAGAIGTSGTLAEFIGLSKSAKSREEVLTNIFLDDRRLSEKFGADVAERISLQTLEKSKQIRKLVEREADESITRGLITKTFGALGYLSPIAYLEEKAIDAYFEAADEESINKKALEQREKMKAALQEQIKQDKLDVLRDVEGASKRKQAAIRDQSLEAERIRRNMQTARF